MNPLSSLFNAQNTFLTQGYAKAAKLWQNKSDTERSNSSTELHLQKINQLNVGLTGILEDWFCIEKLLQFGEVFHKDAPSKLMQTSNSTVLPSTLPLKGCKFCLKVFIGQNSALCDFDTFRLNMGS